MLGFLIAWLVNSSIVAVIAGFQSGAMDPGQWIVALSGGLVLNWLEAKALRHLLGANAPALDPVTGEPTPFRAMVPTVGQSDVRRDDGTASPPGFSYDQYGFRFDVTPTTIEMASKLRGSTSIPLDGIRDIEPHATGAFTIHWDDPRRGPVRFKANLGSRNGEAFRAMDDARRALNLPPVSPFVPPSHSAEPAAGSAPVVPIDAGPDSTSSGSKSTGLPEDIVVELATSLGGQQLIWGALDESTRAFYVATVLDCWRQDAPEMRLIPRGSLQTAHDQEMNLQRLHWLGYCRGILETYALLVANPDALIQFAEASMDRSDLPPDWPKSRAESVLDRDAYADAGEYEAAIERYSAAWYRASFTFATNMLRRAVSE